jgi:hypothetical protein
MPDRVSALLHERCAPIARSWLLGQLRGVVSATGDPSPASFRPTQLSAFDPSRRQLSRLVVAYQIGHVAFSLMSISWTNLQHLYTPHGCWQHVPALRQLQRVPQELMFVVFFVDALVRVLRTAAFFAEFHLFAQYGINYVLIILFLSFWALPVYVTFSRLCHPIFWKVTGYCLWGYSVMGVSFAISPWTLLCSPTFREDFNAYRYGIIFVLDVIANNAIIAWLAFSRTAGASIASCLVDVAGVCATSIAPASCFPFGIVVAFAAAWACQVLLWAWAAMVMWRAPVGSALLSFND